jgi:hypothetical protein
VLILTLIQVLPAAHQLSLTERFGHIDSGFHYQYLMTEPFGQLYVERPPWVNGSAHLSPHESKNDREVWQQLSFLPPRESKSAVWALSCLLPAR